MSGINVEAAEQGRDDLAARWALTSPHDLEREARVMLGRVLAGLREGGYGVSGRQRLLEVATDAALLAGHAAVAGGRAAAAWELLTAARSLAGETGRGELVSRASGSASTALSHTGRPAAALDLLDHARATAEPGVWALWVEIAAARQYAALDDGRAAHGALDAAYGQLGRGDGHGFLSTMGYFAGWDASYMAGQSGMVLGLLGATEEALAELRAALGAPTVRARATGRCLVDAAHAYTVAGDPEMACATAGEALAECRRTGYRLGDERLRQLRATFPGSWALPCVRELDEQFHLV
ncbi:MAG: hypothetical protein ACRDZO_01795 [Egibacteraceae bacterium]